MAHFEVLKNKWVKSKSNISSNSTIEKVNVALDKISPPRVSTNPELLPQCYENKFLSEPFQFSECNIALDSRKKNHHPDQMYKLSHSEKSSSKI